MKQAQLREIFDRVLTWPPERQEDAARMLREMEEQVSSAMQLNPAQTAEVRRRLANSTSNTIPVEQVFSRFRSS